MATKLIPILLLSFLGGVGLRSFFDVSLELSWAIFGALCGFMAVQYSLLKSFRFEKVSILALALLLFFLGIIRLSYFEKNIEKDNLHNFYGEILTIEGVVLENKFTQASQRIVALSDEGKILLVTKVFPQYKYGDVLSISGSIEEPKNFKNINMKKILAKDKIYSQMVFPKIEKIGFAPPSKIMRSLLLIKEEFERKLKSVLPEPHFSLASGMLLGNEGVLEESVKEAFQKSGTIHILVLSGYNITVVGAALLQFFGFLPAVLGIILFVLMTGAEAPAVRAAIMGIIGLLVFYSGRAKTAVLVLFWSAFLMVMWSPAVLSFDRGFQLSFLATLGLIVASPFFLKKLSFLPKIFSIKENAASTLGAQIFVLPLLLSWGNFVSFLSPIANIFIVAVVPYVMAFSFLGGLVAFMFKNLGVWIASVSYVLISYQIYAAKFFSIF
ncbi:MAG: ComEC/Rec2 family competence protein [Patescibacteria group bacterium]